MSLFYIHINMLGKSESISLVLIMCVQCHVLIGCKMEVAAFSNHELISSFRDHVAVTID